MALFCTISSLESPRALRRHAVAMAAASLCAAAAAQTTQRVIVTAPAQTAAVSGLADTPQRLAPLQATLVSAGELRDNGARRLADVAAFDPAVSDAYNAEGYWDTLTVRGFAIDNRNNFRRDGLPINGETSIPLDNKSRVEILKGTSGLQAGVSAPGGLVNYVVKRPTAAPVRSAFIEWRQGGSVLGSVDLGQRFGAQAEFGLRLNAAAERLDPPVRSARGERHLVALAADWRVSGDTLVEAEFETSRQSQPSVPGFSLLGPTVPDARSINPRINLNNQPWSLPVVFEARTASLRLNQRLSADWSATAHAATQQLKTDDRVAFPFGCFSPDPAPDGTYYSDRYCPDGSFDFYDYRSDNERRRNDVIDAHLEGRVQTGDVRHALRVGVQRNVFRARFEGQAFNAVGTGTIDGLSVTPPDPSTYPAGADRAEASTELYLSDSLRLAPQWRAWAGLRHTALQRNGTAQSFNSPWLAAGYLLTPTSTVYASWGRGVESEVAPALPLYSNAGQPLPALQSRQLEAGYKGHSDALAWSLAAFDIVRPATNDLGACDVADSCTRAIDGNARHRGIDASLSWQQGEWGFDAAAQALHARREGSRDAALNGLQPANVPNTTLKLGVNWSPAAWSGLQWQANLLRQGARMATPDNSARIPAWTRLDVGVKLQQQVAATQLTWRAGIDNLTDTRAWKEAPYQFGHAYLFPLAPRSLRISLQADL